MVSCINSQASILSPSRVVYIFNFWKFFNLRVHHTVTIAQWVTLVTVGYVFVTTMPRVQIVIHWLIVALPYSVRSAFVQICIQEAVTVQEDAFYEMTQLIYVLKIHAKMVAIARSSEYHLSCASVRPTHCRHYARYQMLILAPTIHAKMEEIV